jgi:serine/threonine-protein kinase SRPK3
MKGHKRQYFEQFEPHEQLFAEENIAAYAEGGFHPIVLGDTFQDGRYTICHKLGFGAFSTVWLAQD